MMKKILKKILNNLGNSKKRSGHIRFPIYENVSIWGARDYNGFANSGYMQNVIAFRSVNIVAEAVSSVPIVLYGQQKGSVRGDVITTHPLLDIISSPNPSISGIDFMQNLVSHVLISGNAYILKIGSPKVKELHLLRPDRVTIIPDRSGMPSGYAYTVDDNTTKFSCNKFTGESQIIHIKSFHPLNDWYGMSPMEAAYYSIDQHNQASFWNQSMLRNGARPSGAIIVKDIDGSGGNLSAEQYDKIRMQIEESYIGSKNTGRPILLEGGLDWKEMSITPKDMDFINAKNVSAREIALAFGVPPQIIGIPGDNTYNNLVEARISLWEQTVLPRLDNILSYLNSSLVGSFGEGLKLGYNKDDLEVISSKREKMWNYVEKSSFMTVNEKRKFFGLPTIAGKDNIEV